MTSNDWIEILIEYRFWLVAIIALGFAKIIWGKTPWGKFVFNVGNWLQAATLSLAAYGGFMAYIQWQVQVLGNDVVLGSPPDAVAEGTSKEEEESDLKAWKSLMLKDKKKKEKARENWTVPKKKED